MCVWVYLLYVCLSEWVYLAPLGNLFIFNFLSSSNFQKSFQISVLIFKSFSAVPTSKAFQIAYECTISKFSQYFQLFLKKKFRWGDLPTLRPWSHTLPGCSQDVANYSWQRQQMLIPCHYMIKITNLKTVPDLYDSAHLQTLPGLSISVLRMFELVDIHTCTPYLCVSWKFKEKSTLTLS